MKFLLSVGFLMAFCVVAFGQNDEQCKNDFKSFLTCAKTSSSESERQARKKDLQDKSDQCFQQANCDSPNWESSPMGGGKGGAGGRGAMSMPESVKKCMKQKMVEKMGAKMNDCLAKKGVRNVDWSAMADSAEGSGMGGAAGGASGDMEKGMIAIYNAVKAIDKCCTTKKNGDTDAMKPLEQCLHTVKKSIKPQICAALKPCEDKVSAPCKTRGQEIRKALCQCKKEKEQEIAAKLRTAGAKPKVSFQELIKTIANDQDISDMMDQVEQCYKDNGEAEPAMLKLAKAMMGRSGSASGPMANAMSINGSACIIMSDMLVIDANDQSECDKCQ